MAAYRPFELRILGMIAYITTINYFDRSAISYAILPLQKELGLTDAQFGIAAGGFGIGYLVMAVLGGILIEKFDCARVWAWAAAAWSLVTFATGWAGSFSSLLLLRILLGVAEGVHFSAILKMSADWLPKPLRARSIAIGLFGVPLSSLVGAPFLTLLMDHLGWRGMYFILGALGLIWAAVWTLSFKGKTNPRLSGYPPRQKIFWKEFLSLPFLANCLAFMVFGYILFFGLMWLPGMLEKTYGATFRQTGFYTMGPWLSGAIFVVAGGWLSDRIYLKNRSLFWSRSSIIAAGMFCSSLCFFLLLFASSLPFYLLMLSLGIGFAMFANAPIYAVNGDLYPKTPGAAQGIANSFFAFSGLISPAITGWIVQETGTFMGAIGLTAVLAAGAGVIALFGRRASIP